MKKIVIIAMMVGVFSGLNAGTNQLTNNDYKIPFDVSFDNYPGVQSLSRVTYVTEYHDGYYRSVPTGGRLNIPGGAKRVTVAYNGKKLINNAPIDWTKSGRLVMDLDHNWSIVPIL